MRGVVILALGVAVSATGCSSKPDYKQYADDRVREQLSDRFEKREAIPFFEDHGKFFDRDDTTTVDRDVILPLLKRLAEVDPTEQWVILKPFLQDSAVALVVRLPKSAKTVDRMAQAVQEADDEYSGFIIQQWGHEWLSMALVDQTGYEFLKKADPDVEKQR
jgi:hypothetical protein